MKNLTIVLENRPGAMAAACEAIGHAGVNIEGVCCFSSQGVAIMYVAVVDATTARRAVEKMGLRISEERDVAVTPIEDKPGSAARTLRRIADAGINLELAYVATGPRLIVATSDDAKTKAILRPLERAVK